MHNINYKIFNTSVYIYFVEIIKVFNYQVLVFTDIIFNTYYTLY